MFRYYSPDEGIYISQDPIRLAGNNPTLYGYVKDVNSWVDVFGLDCGENRKIAKELSEPEVRKRLEQKYPTSDYEIVGEPRIYILGKDGKATSRYSKPDFMVVDRKNENIVDIVDAKNGGGGLTQNQIDLNTNGGIFRGSSRSQTLPKSRGETQISKGSVRVERTNF